MPERTRHSADDIESESAVYGQSNRIGGGNGVELDPQIAFTTRPRQHELAQGRTDSSPSCISRNHETGGCDVRPGSGAVSLHMRSPHNLTTIDGNHRTPGLLNHPRQLRFVRTHRRVVGERLLRFDDISNDRPHRNPVFLHEITNVHLSPPFELSSHGTAFASVVSKMASG